MKPTTHRPTRSEFTKLGDKFVDACKRRDNPAASGIAEELVRLGVQSLERLMPRGTLECPAPDRWHHRLTGEVAGLLTSVSFADPLAAATLKVLAYFAGGDAVAEIEGALLRCTNAARPSGSGSDTLITGLYSLHMIGGPKAARVLREFQHDRHPARIRERAYWYLNELGSPTIDLQFASEAEDLTAEKVLRRDKLPD